MYGGIAVSRNLLCLTYTAGCGRVFLVDLEECQPVDFWEFHGPDRGFADAGGVAIDDSFTVHVADTHNEVVRRFTAFGKELVSIGGAHQRPPGAARRDRRGLLQRPHAVAVHLDDILVACGEQRLRRGVQRFGKDGVALAPLLSGGDPEAEFGAPRGLCAGDQGIFVADTLNGQVQRFSAEGRFVNSIKTSGRGGGVGRPVAVQALADDSLLVVDQGDQPGLRHYDFGGQLIEAVASGDHLIDPVDLALDDHGRIYVLDRDGERVLRLRPNLALDLQILDLAEYLHDS